MNKPLTLFLTVLALCSCSKAEKPKEAEQPAKTDKPMNVVVMLADDWRFDTLGAAGNPIVKTPHLDKLANEGVNFTQGYAANATCAPSRAALMTGRYGTRFGFEFTPTPPGMSRILSPSLVIGALLTAIFVAAALISFLWTPFDVTKLAINP